MKIVKRTTVLAKYLSFFVALTTLSCWSAQQNDLEAPLLHEEPTQNRLYNKVLKNRFERDIEGFLLCLVGIGQIVGNNQMLEYSYTALYYASGIISIGAGCLGYYLVRRAQEERARLQPAFDETHDRTLHILLKFNGVAEDQARLLQAGSFSFGMYATAGLLPTLSFIPAAKFLAAKIPRAPSILNVFGGSAAMAVPICCWVRDAHHWLARRCSRQAQAQAN